MYIRRLHPKFGVFLLCLTVYIDLTVSCQYEDCTSGYSCSDYGNSKKGYLQTVYSEYYKGEHHCRRHLCCRPGTNEFKALQNGPGCFATKCVDYQKHRNPCDSVDIRETPTISMNIQLQSVYDEACILPNGLEGIISVCCQPGHKEQFLTLGYAAEKREFPHQVQLSMGCAGTIYNEQWIITAAHCLVDKNTGAVKNPSEITVRAGSNIERHGSKIYTVKQVKVHEDYSELAKNKNKPGNAKRIINDIALVKVEWIEFGLSIKALRIAPRNFNPIDFGTNAIMVGWGRSDNYQKSPPLLRKSFIQIRDIRECEERYPKPFFSDQVMCVGGIIRLLNGTLDRGVVAGGGDSGGPAICRGPNGNALLCGITSFGGDDDKCDEHKNERRCPPSVYSSVSYYNPWIHRNAGNQQNDPIIEFHTIPFSAEKIESNQFNYHVQIKSNEKGKDFCGGTLVSKNTVVTAAHCVYQLEESGILHEVKGLHIQDQMGKRYFAKYIYTNEHNFKIANKFAIVTSPFTYKEKNVKMLDDFYYNYDIVVLKLDENVNNVKFLQLPPRNFDMFQFGMKVIEIARNRGGYKMLNKRGVNLLTNSECQIRYNAFNINLRPENTTVYLNEEFTPKRQDWITTELDPKALEEIRRRSGGPRSENTKDRNLFQTEASNSAELFAKRSEWFRENLKEVKLSPRESCYVEKYSGGSTCDRELGGPIICEDFQTGQQYLCGIQTFRFCMSAFPNIFVDVTQFSEEISKYLN